MPVMSFHTRMKFCWRRFRHFVAAYFVLGLSATLAHGAMTFSLFDVSASEEPMSELISPEAAPLAAEEASAPEIENPPEEMVPAEEGPPAVNSVVEGAPEDTVDGAETAPEVIPPKSCQENQSLKLLRLKLTLNLKRPNQLKKRQIHGRLNQSNPSPQQSPSQPSTKNPLPISKLVVLWRALSTKLIGSILYAQAQITTCLVQPNSKPQQAC